MALESKSEITDEIPYEITERDSASQGTSTSVISLQIIETLAQSRVECGVTELAHNMGMTKARIHRHLSSLRDSGYVAQNPKTNRYSIGWKLFLLGQSLVKQYDIVGRAKPIMTTLRDRVGQTVVISTFTDTEMVVLDFVPGITAIEIVLRAGTRFDFNAVAQGKVALAFGPCTLLSSLLAGPLKSHTSHTIVDPERLISEVDLIKRRGWADAPEQLFVGINALSAPIFNADDTLFGTLTLAGSIHYLPQNPNPDTVTALVTAASEVSALLGWDG